MYVWEYSEYLGNVTVHLLLISRRTLYLFLEHTLTDQKTSNTLSYLDTTESSLRVLLDVSVVVDGGF